MDVLAATQTMGQRRQGARHQERLEISGTAASCVFIQPLLFSSQSTYTQIPGLKVTGCEINWAVNSIFQQTNYPESLSKVLFPVGRNVISAFGEKCRWELCETEFISYSFCFKAGASWSKP